MRKWTQLALAVALTAGAALAEQWTGYIAEQKCAEAGTYNGDQYTKCMQGKDVENVTLVFVNEADKKIYVISNADKIKSFGGKKVTLVGKANGTTIEAENCSEDSGRTQQRRPTSAEPKGSANRHN